MSQLQKMTPDPFRLFSNLLFASRMSFARFHPFSGNRVPDSVPLELHVNDPDIVRHALTFQTYVETFIAVCRARHQEPILMTQPLGIPNADQAHFNHTLRGIASTQKVALIDL